MAYDPPARRAEREPDRDFPRAGGTAGEQHVGEVQARDDQNGTGHRHEQRPDQRDRAVVLRRRANAKPRRVLDLHLACSIGVGRLNGGETLSQDRQARFRRVDVEAGLQTCR